MALQERLPVVCLKCAAYGLMKLKVKKVRLAGFSEPTAAQVQLPTVCPRCEGQECLRLSGLPSTGRAPPFRPEEGSE